ncbi:MAG: DUF2330 domain-containing protein [bacterium]
MKTMYLKDLYKLLPIIMLLFFSPRLTMADGWWPPPITIGSQSLINSPYQKAVIVWNSGTKQETMLLSTTAKTESIANLCWIVPIKSTTQPLVVDCEFDIFWDIARLFAPTYWSWLPHYYSAYGSYQAPAQSGVTVIDFKELDIYDIYLLYVTDPQELVNWLDDYDFLVPGNAVNVFQKYTSGGCYFVINKIDLANDYLTEISILQDNAADLYQDFLDGDVTGAQFRSQISSRIYQNAHDHVSYSQSIARFFIQASVYGNLTGVGQVPSSVTSAVDQKLKGLTDTVTDVRTGVATPLKFTFTPTGGKATYPLILTSLAGGNTHIEVFTIAPYKVYDSNGMLKHPQSYSQYGLPGGGALSYSSSFFNPIIQTQPRVFIELPNNLKSTLTTEYAISLPQGTLWCTRLLYKGGTASLTKDAVIEEYTGSIPPSPITYNTCSPSCGSTLVTCSVYGCGITSGTCGKSCGNTYSTCGSYSCGLTVNTCSSSCGSTYSTCGYSCGSTLSTCGYGCGSTYSTCGYGCAGTYSTCGYSCGSTYGTCGYSCGSTYSTCGYGCKSTLSTCGYSCAGTYSTCGYSCGSTYSTCGYSCAGTYSTCGFSCNSTYSTCGYGCGSTLSTCGYSCGSTYSTCGYSCGSTLNTCGYFCGGTYSTCGLFCNSTFDTCGFGCIDIISPVARWDFGLQTSSTPSLPPAY